MAIEELMSKALGAVGEPDSPLIREVFDRLMTAQLPDEPMTVQEVADLLDTSPHTLRYYERIGLVAIDRDTSGHRRYDADAVRRLVFLTRMRLSGMPIRDLQHYISLVDQGADTVPERLEMLLEHRDTLRRQIRELTLSLAATEYKIATYGGDTAP